MTGLGGRWKRPPSERRLSLVRGFFAVVDMAFRLFFRDHHGLFWGIAFPLILMGLIGTVFGGTMNLVLKTSVVVEADDPIGSDLFSAMRDVPSLDLIVEDEEAAKEALRRGDRSLVVILPSGEPSFEPDREPLPVTLYYDDANHEVATTGIAIVSHIVEEFNRRAMPRTDLLRIVASGVAGRQLSMFDFLLPGILAMVLMQSGLMGVTAVMTSYRERLLLKRILATPFPPFVFLSGLVARFAVTNLMQGAIVVAVGVWVFGATIVGAYGDMLVLALIGSISFIAVGFAISTMSKTPDGANTFGSAVAFPMMFLSGTFWPREFVPPALQPFIDALPLTPLVEALRGVTTQGDLWTAHTGGMLYLSLWAAVSLIVAARRFRWE